MGRAPAQAHGLVSLAQNGESSDFLPLLSVKVDALVADVTARVEITQRYENSAENTSSAAQYIFPLPENAAVTAFRMESTDGTVIRAIVEELSKAKKDFDTAVADSKRSALLYEASADVFVVSIGAIPAGQDITVIITYVQELAQDELIDQVKFALPTYVADRYGPAPPELSSKTSSTETTTFSLSIDVQMTSQITQIDSPSHRIDWTTPATKGSGSAKSFVSTVSLQEKTPLTGAKEFVMTVLCEDLHNPRCIAELNEKKQSVALNLTLVPGFGAEPIIRQEYIFLIDRSWSMSIDSRIDFAKSALQLLLPGLPFQDADRDYETYFNIYSFGSAYSSLWSSSQRYTDDTRKQAMKHVDSMSADMGNTEILDAIENILSVRSKSMPTAVFVLTDGEVWDTNNVINTVRTRIQAAGKTAYVRMFTLGIGDGASTALCEGLARAGNGICYMTMKAEAIAQRCKNLCRAAAVPPTANLWNLSIDWNRTESTKPKESQQKKPKKQTFKLFENSAKELDESDAAGTAFKLRSFAPVQQAPTAIPDLYSFNRFFVSAILSDTQTVPDTITLHGKMPDGTQIDLPFSVTKIDPQKQRMPLLVHSIAAKRLITELEDGDITSVGQSDGGDPERRDEIAKVATIKLSVEFQMASKYTAFLAVEDNKPDDNGDYPDKDPDASDDEEEDEAAGSDDENEDRDDDDDDDDDDEEEVKKKEKSKQKSSFHQQQAGSNQKTFKPRTHLLTSNMSVQHPTKAFKPSQQTFSLPTSPPGVVFVPGNDPVTAVARLQSVDGSFALDSGLASVVVGSAAALARLKSSIPSDITHADHPDKVWASLLVAAYLQTRLPDSRGLWVGLSDKAMKYVMKEVHIGPFMFVQLLQKAIQAL